MERTDLRALADRGVLLTARLRMYDAGLHPESQAELRTPDGSRRVVDFLFRRVPGGAALAYLTGDPE
ncbi:hypothetical protein [Streptomyces puniciscabiei]|uniref:hypothetical protein n=1 Tax=Streptomyces puniciscabiei TaxID=164348 RepID=UPI00331F5890